MMPSRSAWLFVAHLAASRPLAQALKCGISGFTKPCIGEKDVRYDAEVSYDLKSNSDFWANYEGLTSGLNYRYGSDRTPNRNTPIIGLEAFGNFSMFPTRIFQNTTVDGARCTRTQYEIFESVSGGPGIVFATQSFYTSTFEKDGSARLFGVIAPLNDEALEFAIRPEGEAITPSGDTTGEIHAREDENLGLGAVAFENQISIIADGETESRVESLFTFPDGDRTLFYMMSAEFEQKEESEWLEELDAAFDEARVFTPETRPELLPARFAKPAIAINSQRCIKVDQDMCPTVEHWQQVDPNYNETPYNEPDGQLEGGIIALFVIVGALFFALAAALLHRRAAAAQRRRYKEHFVRGIARNIDIAPTAGMIETDQLQKEFDHIDKDGGGSISKDELKSFVQGGKLGRISDKDFEALWAAIDIDNSGEVDFVEFLSFLGSCGAEFDSTNKEMKRMTKEDKMKFASQRLSVKNLSVPEGTTEE